MTAAEAMKQEIQQMQIPLDQLVPSPFNPRKDFGAPEEWASFVDSVRQHGVMTPILARRRKAAVGEAVYEIIFGERRVRALREAGGTSVLAMLRDDMTDLDVRVVQLVENALRKGLHPLEEAEAYRGLQELGKTVPEIAADVKKTVREVHAVKQLLKLCPKARELFLKPKSPLTKSNAQLVARITGDEKRQLKYLAEITDAASGSPMTFEQAEAHLRQNYTLSLKDARFELSDAALIPGVGACGGCEFNTSTQPDLFADMPKQVCLNAPCFHRKSDAGWAATVAQRKLQGLASLSAADAKRVFEDQPGPLLKSGYTLADAACLEDSKKRSYKQLLGKSARGAIVLARAPSTGAEVELLETAGLRAKVMEAGYEFWPDPASRRSPVSGEGSGGKGSDDDVPDKEVARRAREKAEREQLVRHALAGHLVAAVEKSGPSKAYFQVLIRDLIESSVGDLVLKRRFAKEEGDPKAVEKWLDKAGEPQLAGLLFELVLENLLYERAGGQTLKALLAHYKVDEADVRAEVKTALSNAPVPRNEFKAKLKEAGFTVVIQPDEGLKVTCSRCPKDWTVTPTKDSGIERKHLAELLTHAQEHDARAKKKGGR